MVSKFKKLEKEFKGIPQLVSEWETYGESLRMINNGVATIVNAIHAMDSSMAMNTYSQFNALNVHDAIVSSMADSNQVAITYNREAYRQLRDYSVLDEVKKSVIKTLSSISDKIDTNTHLRQQTHEKLSLYIPAVDFYNLIDMPDVSFPREPAHVIEVLIKRKPPELILIAMRDDIPLEGAGPHLHPAGILLVVDEVH